MYFNTSYFTHTHTQIYTLFTERQGLHAALVIPFGEVSSPKNARTSCFVFLFLQKNESKLSFFSKIKKRFRGIFAACGETGIRTLGPGYPGQRFSRPPHSTALAPLRSRCVFGGGCDRIVTFFTLTLTLTHTPFSRRERDSNPRSR